MIFHYLKIDVFGKIIQLSFSFFEKKKKLILSSTKFKFKYTLAGRLSLSDKYCKKIDTSPPPLLQCLLFFLNFIYLCAWQQPWGQLQGGTLL